MTFYISLMIIIYGLATGKVDASNPYLIAAFFLGCIFRIFDLSITFNHKIKIQL